MNDRIGERLDDYCLLRFLGEGTFGDVYYGEHVYQHTPAAIKVFKTRLTPDRFRDFINEVSTSMLLQHANIVQLIHFGMGENDIPYLVMKYAPNGTLRQRHQRGASLPLDTVVTYVKQVATALQYAHDQRRIHRDVKPENMLVGRHGEILLSDFGIAAVAHSERSMKTQGMAGTAPYMAPEQIQGKPCPASDQYALGIVVYEWLCGARPFRGETEYEIMKQHMEVSPPSLCDKVPTISREVEQVIMIALAKDPAQRFKHVRAFALALEAASKSGLPLPPKSTIILPSPSTPLAPPGQQHQVVPSVDGMVAGGVVPAANDAPQSKSTRNAVPSTPVPSGAKDSSVLAPASSAPPAANISPSGANPAQASAPNVPTGGNNPDPSKSHLPTKQPRIPGDVAKAAPVAPVVSLQLPPAKRASRQPNSGRTGPVGAAATTGAAGGRATARPASSQGRRRLGWPILLVLLLLLTCLLCSGVAFALPKQTQAVTSTVTKMVSNLVNPQAAPSPFSATVTIAPASQVVQNSYSVQAVTSGASAIQHQVVARQVSYTTPAQQKIATATGHTQTKGVQAMGTLTFTNGNFNSYTIASGTTFPALNGVQVVNNVLAVIPAATNNGQQGRVTVAAHALTGGTAGNIPAGNVNILPCCGSSSVAVSNTVAFTGGQDPKNYSFLQQGDIDSVAAPLKESLLPKAQSGLKSQMRSSEQPVGSPQCSPKVSSNQVVGDSGVNITSATVTVSVTCTQEVYDQQGVQTLVTDLLKKKAATDPTLAGYALVGNVVAETKVQGVDDKGTVTLGVTAKGEWVYQFSKAQQTALAKSIAGLSAEQAKAKLLSQAGVAAVSFAAGVTTLPSDPTQITITILPVAGLSGGGGTPTSGTPTVTGATVTAPAGPPSPTPTSIGKYLE